MGESGFRVFTREGPDVIDILKKMNKKIFLDLKFHDIPNTMSAACYQISKLGVDIISVHASAGSPALKASKKASLEGAKIVNIKPPLVVGITVLTSFSLKDYQTDLDRNNTIEQNVLSLQSFPLMQVWMDAFVLLWRQKVEDNHKIILN